MTQLQVDLVRRGWKGMAGLGWPMGADQAEGPPVIPQLA
jgi:hypothetical protein